MSLHLPSAALALLVPILSACVAPCGLSGCPGDAEVTARVKARFAQEPELEAPNQVYVRTINHVVYLTGLVDTPFERATAESLARETPGVTRVANMIGLAGNEH